MKEYIWIPYGNTGSCDGYVMAMFRVVRGREVSCRGYGNWLAMSMGPVVSWIDDAMGLWLDVYDVIGLGGGRMGCVWCRDVGLVKACYFSAPSPSHKLSSNISLQAKCVLASISIRPICGFWYFILKHVLPLFHFE